MRRQEIEFVPEQYLKAVFNLEKQGNITTPILNFGANFVFFILTLLN